MNSAKKPYRAELAVRSPAIAEETRKEERKNGRLRELCDFFTSCLDGLRDAHLK